MNHPFLIGASIYLRPLDRADAALLVPWVNDPLVMRTLLLHRPMSLQAEEAFLARAAQDPSDVVLGIALKRTDRLIGVTALHQLDAKDRHVSFGLFIGDRRQWGKGYATEATRLMVRYAFETLNLNRVWLHVFEYNAAALRVYEKVGFRREGVLRQHHFRDGRYWDTIPMALLREEWQAGHET